MEKIAIITGITGGIGSALLRKFVENGYFVIGQFCNNSSKIEEWKNGEFAQKAEFFQCDFSDIKNASSLGKKICSRYKKIDCLINNAGISLTSVFQDSDDDALTKITSVNLLAPMAFTREIMKNMISEKAGAILNVSSIWGTYGGSCEVAYSATKGGLIAFTKALSRELGPSNVRVNALSLGFIDTAMNKHLTECDKAAFCENLSLGRIGTPQDAAEAAYFLCSDRSSYITGEVLAVDGGY